MTPYCRDSTSAAVTWKASPDLSALRGQPVYVRFELEHIRLFAFPIRNA